jgi:hypothetical protein
MANVERQMQQFHEKIKLKRFEENQVLCEKRDIILERLKGGLKKFFEERNLISPKIVHFNQGSYAMGTGNKPIDGDYDIDVGISFKIAKADYPDPVEIKKWVYLALEGHTKEAVIRRSCVTVYYQRENEPIYHVDLAIYSDADCNLDGKMYLAKGKLNSTSEHRIWEEADPKGLIDLIDNHYLDSDDAKQFRRTIRYLKRWKEVKFEGKGNAAPLGIGITVAAYNWFSRVKTVDSFARTAKYDDLEALRQFIDRILLEFKLVYSNGRAVERLEVLFPLSPKKDVFEKMSNSQMQGFKEKLENLLDTIKEAQQEADPVEACQLLQKQFGGDFPVPKKEETARKRSPSIISSSASA